MSVEERDPNQSFIARAKTALQLGINNDEYNATAFSCGYVLGKTIGKGSYAVVKLGYSKAFDRLVAVKVITRKDASPTFLNHFLPREIKVVKRLKHKNIISYYQCIETSHRYFISMEYAMNGNLLDHLMQMQYFDEETSRKYFGQIVDAVEYCHKYNIVHRDLKLENLMLDAEYNIKIGDFGFSRHVNGSSEDSDMKTLSNTFCGSNSYASPEILKSIPYEPKYADVWALGVILYSMVYGCFPFNDKSYQKLVRQVERPVVFHTEPFVNYTCRDLIAELLSPIECRPKIAEVKRHIWLRSDILGYHSFESRMK